MAKSYYKKDETKCAVKKCRNESTIIYLGKPLCDKHWEEECEK